MFEMEKSDLFREEPDWWDELSVEEQTELDSALEQSENEENWIADDEAQQLIQSWLKEENTDS